MPQTTFGQTDALALAIVTWLTAGTFYIIGNQASPQPFCINISAERRFHRIDDLKNIPAWNAPASVDVFPDIEMGKREGIAPAFLSEYAVHIYIQQMVAGAVGGEAAQCALLLQLRSQIIEGIKPLRFNLANAVHPVVNIIPIAVKNADKGLYGLDRLLNDHVFESDTILIFKAAA